MLKDFFRDGAIYGGAKVLASGFTLLAVPIYAHALEPAEYGVVDLLTTIASIAYVTVALEIAQGLARFVMAPEAKPVRERYASTAFWFTIVAYSIFLSVALPFGGRISSSLFGSIAYASPVRVMALVIWGTGIFYLLQNVLRYSGRAAKYGIASIVYSGTSVGVTLVLLLVLHTGLVAVFIGQFVAALIAAALAFWFAKDAIRPVFDRRRCREMLAFSLPLVPSGVGVMLCLYVDRFAVLRMLSVTELGFYGVAFRIASVVAIVTAGFEAALAPLIYQHYREADTPRQLARTFEVFLAFAISLVLFLAVFADVLVRIVAPATYAPAAKVVLPISAALLVARTYNFSPGLWIAKKTGRVATISLVVGVLNLLLNLVFIPKVGLIGAALATLTSSAAGAVAHFVLGGLLYPVPYRWRRVGPAVVLATVGAAVANSGLFEAPGLSLRVSIAIRAFLFVVLAFAGVLILVGAADLRTAGDRLLRLLLRRPAPLTAGSADDRAG